MIVRVKKDNNYTIIDNTIFSLPKDNKISARATGLFAYIMHLPNDWKFYKKEIFNHFSEGKDALNTAWKELEDKGYIIYYQKKDDKGRFDSNECIVYEKPIEKKEEDFPLPENPSTEKPLSENPHLLNTNNTNYLLELNTNNILSKDNIYTKSDDFENIYISSPSESNINNSINLFTKKCMDLHYEYVKLKSPRVKHDPYYDHSEIIKVENLLLNLLKGFRHRDYSALWHWAKDEDIFIQNIIEKGFDSEDDLYNFLEKACLAYKDGFYPNSKVHLPNRLSNFIYDINSVIKSKLLYWGVHHKSTEEVKVKKDEYKNITEKYITKFFHNKIDSKNWNKLIDNVNEIVKEFEKINPILYDENGLEYERWQVERNVNFRRVCKLDQFVDIHIDYLLSRNTVSIGMVNSTNGWWDGFVEWLKKEYNIILYRNSEELNRMTNVLMNERIEDGRYDLSN